MREPGKLYGQAVAIARTLVADPKRTATLVYANKPTAERVRVYLREIASNFPGMEDWEKRVKFQNVNDRPNLETLPKIPSHEEKIPSHEEMYKQKCNLFVILSHCHDGVFANGFCRTREKANELIEKNGSKFNKHSVEGHILDMWTTGGLTSLPTVGPSLEKGEKNTMRTFKPLGDRLLVRPDAPTEKKTTGLAAPPSQKEAPTEGIVVAMGPGVKVKSVFTQQPGFSKTNNPDGLAIGERVAYTKYAGRDVMHNGVKHKLLRLEEVEGIIEDVAE